VTGALIGFRNVNQVEGIIGSASFRLSDEEMTEIECALTRQVVA